MVARRQCILDLVVGQAIVSDGTCHLFVCSFSALRAEKLHTIEKRCTALPKAQYANCVSPILFLQRTKTARQQMQTPSCRSLTVAHAALQRYNTTGAAFNQ